MNLSLFAHPVGVCEASGWKKLQQTREIWRVGSRKVHGRCCCHCCYIWLLLHLFVVCFCIYLLLCPCIFLICCCCYCRRCINQFLVVDVFSITFLQLFYIYLLFIIYFVSSVLLHICSCSCFLWSIYFINYFVIALVVYILYILYGCSCCICFVVYFVLFLFGVLLVLVCVCVFLCST